VSAATPLTFIAATSAMVGLVLAVPVPPQRHARARRRRGGTRLLWGLAAAGAGLAGLGFGPAGGAARAGGLAARVEAAGRPAGLGPRELLAAKIAAALLGLGVGSLLAAMAPGRLGIALAVSAPAAGFAAPELWLRRLAAERARRVRRELPALLDLLRVTVEAGASLGEALRAVGARSTGPLAAEWRALGREVELGVPLEAALAGMSMRLPLPEVRALVAALDRARRHGAPLAQTLEAQGRDARAALARRTREDAARAGPKIQLVVALLLVPSVLLLVAAALASALLGGGAEVVPV